MKIVEYSDAYRDDMIYMILDAKDKMNRIPRLNLDLLDVEGEYIKKGGNFFLAIDDDDRVIGSCGYSKNSEFSVTLHRFYVKANLKHQGIGIKLYGKIEEDIIKKGFKNILIHLGDGEYKRYYPFYEKCGFTIIENIAVKELK